VDVDAPEDCAGRQRNPARANNLDYLVVRQAGKLNQ
jgi:hypothetical protein